MRCTCWVVVLAAWAAAGTEEGLAALEKEDYRTARAEFIAAAEGGDAEAQFQLAEMFRKGQGVSANPRLAARWYEPSVAQGHAHAAARLGILLWNGDGVSKKRDRALELLRKGVEGNSRPAQYKLALLYYKGEKVGLASEAAYELFHKAAEQGHPNAQCIYASALKRGKIGGKKDSEAAVKWYRKAAAQGHPEGFGGVGSYYLDQKNYTQGFDWKTKAALRGDFNAQHFLGLGHGARESWLKAWAWLTIASNLRNSWDETTKVGKDLQKKLSRNCRDLLKNVKKHLSPADVREGKKLAKEHTKTIRANLKLGQPYLEE